MAATSFWLAMIMLVVAPLPLGANRVWAAGLLAPGITTVLLLWAASVARGLSPWPSFDRTARVFFVCFAALCVWFELSRHWVSFDGSSSQWHVNQLWLMLAFALPLYALVQAKPDRAQTVVWTLVLSGVVQTFIGILLFVKARDWHAFFEVIPQGLVKGTFVNRNHTASYLNIALVCGTGLMVGHLAQRNESKNRGSKVKQGVRSALEFALSSKMALRVLLIVIVIGLIGTRSRAGNGIFFVGVLVAAAVAMVAYRSASSRARSKLALFFVSIVVLDVLVIGALVGLDKVIDRFQASYITQKQAAQAAVQAGATAENAAAVAQLEETLEARISPAWPALNALRSRGLTGTGGKTFQWVFPAYKDETAVGLHYEHAHNDYIEHLVEGGLVGFGLLGAMTLSVLFACASGTLRQGRSVPKGIALGCLMALVMTLAHCAVDFPTQIFAIALTLSAVAAVGLGVGLEAANL